MSRGLGQQSASRIFVEQGLDEHRRQQDHHGKQRAGRRRSPQPPPLRAVADDGIDDGEEDGAGDGADAEHDAPFLEPFEEALVGQAILMLAVEGDVDGPRQGQQGAGDGEGQCIERRLDPAPLGDTAGPAAPLDME